MKIFEHNYKVKPYSKRKKTDMVILHCSATKEGKDYTVEQINEWHNARKFNGIGYHYVIYRNGEIHRGRTENAVGAHCTNYNSRSISICYIGGLNSDGKAKDTRTVEQKEAMYELVYDIMGRYPNIKSLEDIHGHYEFAQKSCPCFKSYEFRNEYLKWLEDRKKKSAPFV